MGIWTYNSCLPISTSYYSRTITGGLNSHDSFFDITPGIFIKILFILKKLTLFLNEKGVSDPNIFLVRKECQNI